MEIRLKVRTKFEEVEVKTMKAFAIIAAINAAFLWFNFAVMS